MQLNGVVARNIKTNTAKATNANKIPNTKTRIQILQYVALNGFVREKYLDECFPRRVLSRGEEEETMHHIRHCHHKYKYKYKYKYTYMIFWR